MILKCGVPVSFAACKKLARKLGYKIAVRKNGWFRYFLTINNYEVFGLMWGTVEMLFHGLKQMEFKRVRGIA